MRGDAHSRSSNDSVIDWLLDADASIRWQVMRDLADESLEVIADERSRVASEGWGASLLDQQRPDGQWGDGVATPFWWSNMYTLVWLRDLGVDPTDPRVRTAIDRVCDNVTWGPGFGDSPFFEGEVEPCINGRVVALGAYFGERSDRLVDRLLAEQLVDGGWNCEAERGSVRSSFHTTICVLEGLLAFETAFGVTSAVTDARRRAEEYLLERRLLRRASTGEIIDATWTQLAFPPLWHYDVLRALDYLRSARVTPDERVEEAVAIVRERRQPSGRWALDVRHRDTLYDEMSGAVGEPNRWITLRARRVLDWRAHSGRTTDATPIEIRRASADDADAIADVHVSSWRTTYAGIVDQAYIDSLSVEEGAAAWKRRLADPEPSAPDVLVAVDANRRIVGFISGGEIREPVPGFDAELHAIYLLESHQGIGLGRRLVGEWAALAIRRGLRAAVVRVLAQNLAREFYARLGANVVEESTHAVGDKVYPDVLYGWRDIRDLLPRER